MGNVKPASIVSPEDQRVTFVELFFDLVFVFSVTQVVGLLHHHLDWTGVGQTVLVFWLIWWAWSQFTWALNAADTTHPGVELLTLLATGVVFFMAVALPHAFSDGALWFAIPYVLVRIIGLGLYIRVSLDSSPSHRTAVRTFALLSVGGLAAVLAGGFSGGSATYWFWGLAIVLDIVAALVGVEAGDFDLHPDHFGERHGLFVIIALGETLIVAAGGMSGVEVSLSHILVGALAVATTCALWWSYFGCAKPALDAALANATATDRAPLGRDVFTLMHFVMILGVIAFAVAIEKAILHPADALPWVGRLALALSVTLFTGGMALAIWRATRRLPLFRTLIALTTAVAVVAGAGVAPAVSLVIAFVGVATIAVVEHWTRLPAATIKP